MESVGEPCFCQDHPTILAFTGKTWCGFCKAIEPDLVKLHATPQDTFHFLQFDTKDVENEAVFQWFQIKGYPTILIYNPQKPIGFQRYMGQGSYDQLLRCGMDINACASMLQPYTFTPNLPICLKPHGTSSSTIPKEAPTTLPPLQLCSTCPTVLVFTGVSWCSHCKEVKPLLDNWLQQDAATLGFHVCQFDTDDQLKRIEQFGIQEYPTTLVFDPLRKQLEWYDGKLDVLPELLKSHPSSIGPAWRNAVSMSTCFTLVLCAKTKVMVMEAQSPDMDSTTIMDVQVEVLYEEHHHHHHHEPLLELKMCVQCATLIIFTGDTWCDPCKPFAAEVAKLKKQQQHGKYHCMHVDRVMELKTESDYAAAEWCRCFQVKGYPTILIFNPYDKLFYEYIGLRQCAEIVKFDMAHNVRRWPTPPNLHVSLVHELPEVRTITIQTEVETNGEIRLCANCPTVLLFSMEATTLRHLMTHNIHGLHVTHYCTTVLGEGVVIDLFGINVFPFILVFCPDQNCFFVYKGSCNSLKVIHECVTSTTLRQKWLIERWYIHPRVIMQREKKG